MLAVSSLRNPNNEREGEMEDKEFPDLSGTNLLDSIDFDDLFLGDVLPDLEILGEFSFSDESEVKVPSLSVEDEDFRDEHLITAVSSSPIQEDDTKHESVVPCSKQLPSAGRKSAPNSKNPPGKRKVKVDWTPELHRRFVQAVEQLGVDKAVPSRILELMGIDCLTRHNIASHLQKYRSHRKHLLAREAEAASWSQRRQMYGGSVGKRECGWNTMGFPPVTHFRPLHVWGHPSLDQSVMPIWPKPLWSPPPHDPPSFWIPPHHHHHVPTPCYPPPHLQPARFPGPAVAGMPPGGIYKVEHPGLGFPTVPSGQTLPQPPSDIHPSKESVDAAIGDVLSKPWLPLPLGLKPPSTDGVMVELQRQGISKVPPSCTA